MIKAISPDVVYDFNTENHIVICSIIEEINTKLITLSSSNPQINDYPEILLEGELDYSLRNKIAQEYIIAGWKCVAHQTTSENGERAGLTYFVFLTENTLKKWIDSNDTEKHYMVFKDDVKDLGVKFDYSEK